MKKIKTIVAASLLVNSLSTPILGLAVENDRVEESTATSEQKNNSSQEISGTTALETAPELTHDTKAPVKTEQKNSPATTEKATETQSEVTKNESTSTGKAQSPGAKSHMKVADADISVKTKDVVIKLYKDPGVYRLNMIIEKITVNGKEITDAQQKDYIDIVVDGGKEIDNNKYGVYKLLVKNKETKNTIGSATLTFDEQAVIKLKTGIVAYSGTKLSKEGLFANRTTPRGEIPVKDIDFNVSANTSGEAFDWNKPEPGIYKVTVAYQNAKDEGQIEIVEDKSSIILNDQLVIVEDGKSYIKINQEDQKKLFENSWHESVIKKATDRDGNDITLDRSLPSGISKNNHQPLLPGKDKAMKITYKSNASSKKAEVYLDVAVSKKTAIKTKKTAYEIEEGQLWAPLDEINELVDIFGVEQDLKKTDMLENIAVTYQKENQRETVASLPKEPGNYKVIYEYYGYTYTADLTIKERASYITLNQKLKDYRVNDTVYFASTSEDLPWTQLLMTNAVFNKEEIKEEDFDEKLTIELTKDGKGIEPTSFLGKQMTATDIGKYKLKVSLKEIPDVFDELEFEVKEDLTFLNIKESSSAINGDYYQMNTGMFKSKDITTADGTVADGGLNELLNNAGKKGELGKSGASWYVEGGVAGENISDYFVSTQVGGVNRPKVVGSHKFVIEYRNKRYEHCLTVKENQHIIKLKNDTLTLYPGEANPLDKDNVLGLFDQLKNKAGLDYLLPENKDHALGKLRINGSLPVDENGKIKLEKPNTISEDHTIKFSIDQNEAGGNNLPTVDLKVIVKRQYKPELTALKKVISWSGKWQGKDQFLTGRDENLDTLTGDDVGGSDKKVTFEIFTKEDLSPESKVYDSMTETEPFDTRDKEFKTKNYYVVYTYKYGPDKKDQVTAKTPLVILASKPSIAVKQEELIIEADKLETVDEEGLFDKVVTPQGQIETDVKALISAGKLKIDIKGKQPEMKPGETYTVTYTYDLKEPGFENPQATITVKIVTSGEFRISGKTGVKLAARNDAVTLSELKKLVFESGVDASGKPITDPADPRVTYKVYTKDFELKDKQPPITDEDSLITDDLPVNKKGTMYYVLLTLHRSESLDEEEVTYGKGTLEVKDESSLTLSESKRFAAGKYEEADYPDGKWQPYRDGVVDFKTTDGQTVSKENLTKYLNVTLINKNDENKELTEIDLKEPGHYQATYTYFSIEETIDIYVYGNITVKKVYEGHDDDALADHNPDHQQVEMMKEEILSYTEEMPKVPIKVSDLDHFTFIPTEGQNKDGFTIDFDTREQVILLHYRGETWLETISGQLDFKGKLQPAAQILNKVEKPVTVHVQSTQLKPTWSLKLKSEGFVSSLDQKVQEQDKLTLSIADKSITTDPTTVHSSQDNPLHAKNEEISFGTTKGIKAWSQENVKVSVGANSFKWAGKGADFKADLTWSLEENDSKDYTAYEQAMPLKEGTSDEK